MGRRTIVRVWVQEYDELGELAERGAAVEISARLDVRLELTKPDGEKIDVEWAQG